MFVDYDVVVVGGGPVGCAVARDIAAAGFKVLVTEEHRQIGEPLQCAGLISPRTLKLARVSSKIVLHKLVGARVHAPGGRVLDLTGQRTYGLAIDRIAFDQELAAQAVSAGAEISNCTRVTGLGLIAGGVKVQVRSLDRYSPGNNPSISREQYITCRLVVGADGHNSLVARWLGLPPPPEKIPMYAAEVELPGRHNQIVDLFLGHQVAPGWFGWVIPTAPGQARVGIGSTVRGSSLSLNHDFSKQDNLGRTKSSPRVLFQSLTEMYPHIFRGMRIVRGVGGLVPVGFMSRTYGAHALLVGDAACHVKPISGGGLYLGLEGARLCASVAIDALLAGNFTEEFLSRYQRSWEKKIGLEIRCGLRHREVFLELSDQEMDMLIAFFDRSYWRKLILKYGDLDYHTRLAGKLALAPPWARRFMVNGLKSLLNCCYPSNVSITI